MRTGFLYKEDDCKWLKETHLVGIDLQGWYDFRSFVLQGNEDSPFAVNLYAAVTPHFEDDYLRIVFNCPVSGQYTVFRYDGRTDMPRKE